MIETENLPDEGEGDETFEELEEQLKPSGEPATPEEPAQPGPPSGQVQAPAAPAAKAQPEAPRTVPLAALQEERARRRALDAELRKIREESARWQGELQTLRQFVQRNGEGEAQAQTDYGSLPLSEIKRLAAHDPFAAVEALTAKLEQYEQHFSSFSQTQERTAWEQKVASQLDQDGREFLAQEPRAMEAAQYLVRMWEQSLQAYGMDEMTAREQTRLHILNTADRLLRQGLSPSEVFFKQAQVFGWKPEAPAVQAPATPDPSPATVPAANPDIARIKQGVSTTKSLSSAPGSANKQPMASLKDIADMSDDDFLREYGHLSRDSLSKLLRGG